MSRLYKEDFRDVSFPIMGKETSTITLDLLLSQSNENTFFYYEGTVPRALLKQVILEGFQVICLEDMNPKEKVQSFFYPSNEGDGYGGGESIDFNSYVSYRYAGGWGNGRGEGTGEGKSLGKHCQCCGDNSNWFPSFYILHGEYYLGKNQ